MYPFLLLVLLLPASLLAQPNLQTTLGAVKGTTVDAGNGHSVETFYSIPFAQPPVGHLRFKAPEPAQPWSDVLNGENLPNSCWQIVDTAFGQSSGVDMWNPNTERSEDCLYLNVFKPTGGRSGPKPIMVWIFGDGFWSGTTTLDVYNATQLAAKNDVIVVSIGYRLGAFGFLFTGEEDAPGNAGLLDQALAIKWIYDNAENLGGSKDDVSLFGESAGAVSVGFHLLSPLSKDFFRNAIMESSTPLCDWAIQSHTEATKRVRELAKGVHCESNYLSEAVRCLRGVDPETLANEQWNVVSGYYFDMPFGPVIDGTFLPDHPQQMMDRGDIKKTNILLGVDKNEGIYWDIYGFMKELPLDEGGEMTEEQFDTVLRGIIPNKLEYLAVKNFYEHLTRPNMGYEEIIDAVSGDSLFKCAVVNFGRQYSDLGGRVFMYGFDYRVSNLPWPAWMGVPHGYELQLVFGLPHIPGTANYTDTDREVSDLVMDYWTKFSTNGDPNTAGSDVTWPTYSGPHEKYLEIDSVGTTSVQGRLRHRECWFWDKIMRVRAAKKAFLNLF